jgi:hypothetical protein
LVVLTAGDAFFTADSNTVGLCCFDGNKPLDAKQAIVCGSGAPKYLPEVDKYYNYKLIFRMLTTFFYFQHCKKCWTKHLWAPTFSRNIELSFFQHLLKKCWTNIFFNKIR